MLKQGSHGQRGQGMGRPDLGQKVGDRDKMITEYKPFESSFGRKLKGIVKTKLACS